MKNKIGQILFIVITIAICSASIAQSLMWQKLAHPDSLQVNGVSFAANGTKVASATNCHPAVIRLYDAPNGNITWDYTVGGGLMCMMGVGISSNSQYLATVEEWGNLLIFDYTQNPPDSIATINMASNYAYSMCFSPNSNKIAAGCTSGKLKVFEIPGGHMSLNISAHSSAVNTVTYSHNNLQIASGGADHHIKVWDTLGTLIQTLNGHTGAITSLKYLPGDSILVSSSKDNTIKIWNVSTGALINTITVSGADVNAIDVSPNGNFVITVSADNAIRIWNLTNYLLLSTFGDASLGQPLCVSWSPVNDQAIVGTSMGMVAMYDISSSLTAVEDINKRPQITVYPNPCSEFVYIDLSANSVKTIELYDLMGKRIFFKNQILDRTGLFTLNMKDYRKGTYILRIVDAGNKITVKKLIKE